MVQVRRVTYPRYRNVSTQLPDPHSDAGGAAPPADDVAAPPPSGEAQPLPETDAPATTGSPHEPVPLGRPADDETPDAAPRSQREVIVDELRYWRRTAVLGLVAAALYALTRWDQSRIPTSRRRTVDPRSAPTGGTAETNVAPALAQALQQVQRGLRRRDALAVAALARPEGVRVAPYRGTPPTEQDQTTDPTRLLQAILTDSRPRVLGWREVSDGLVLVLTNGWAAQRLPVDASPALTATSMMAFWLVLLDQRWHWRALTPDHNRQLNQMAQRVAWRPIPRGLASPGMRPQPARSTQPGRAWPVTTSLAVRDHPLAALCKAIAHMNATMNVPARSHLDSAREAAVPRPPHLPTEAELLALERGDPQLRRRTWSALRARFVTFLLEQTDSAEGAAGTPETHERPLAAPAA